MPLSSTNRFRLIVSPEVTWGVAPTTNYTALRLTNESLALTKDVRDSLTLRNDRLSDALYETAQSASGAFEAELIWSAYDSFYEALCGNNFSSTTVTGVSLTFAASTITAGAGTPFAPLLVGQYIRVAGATQSVNNGVFKIAAVTSTVITITGATLTGEVTSGATITGRMLRSGTLEKSFTFEKQFQDIGQYMLCTGMRAQSLTINAVADGMVTAAFAFSGKAASFSGSSVASTVTDAPTHPALTAATNIGSVSEAGVVLTTAIQSLRLTLANSLRPISAVGSKYPTAVQLGQLSANGTLTAYFENSAMVSKLASHTASSLSFLFRDANGKVLAITLPRLYFTAGNPLASGADDDIIVPLDFTAIPDSANTLVQFDVL